MRSHLSVCVLYEKLAAVDVLVDAATAVAAAGLAAVFEERSERFHPKIKISVPKRLAANAQQSKCNQK